MKTALPNFTSFQYLWLVVLAFGCATARVSAAEERYVVREIEPLEMAEWFSHDEWPTQFLDNRWWDQEHSLLEVQPGFRWLTPSFDSLSRLLNMTDLAANNANNHIWIVLGRLTAIKDCEPADKLLIALHAQQEGLMGLHQRWQLNWILGRLYTIKANSELSLYYLLLAQQLATESGNLFAAMETHYALYLRAEILDKKQEWEHYRAYLRSRDMVRARWLKAQLTTDLSVGPPSFAESLEVQRAFLVPSNEKGGLKWLLPALLVLLLISGYWVYSRYMQAAQPVSVARAAESNFEILPLKDVTEVSKSPVKTELSADEEIPVDEEKVEKLSTLHLLKLLTEDDWSKFADAFEMIYDGFQWRLRKKVPDLTPAELRLMCLIRMHLSSREIARRLGISQQSVNISRYRLRRKIGLEHHERLEEYVLKV